MHRYTVKNVHVFVPVFLYAVTVLIFSSIFQIKRIILSEKWFNYVGTFFGKCQKFGSVGRR